MIIKDTPRNIEFLNGNPRDLAPMTREEAVLAGEVVEPLNVNEALISSVCSNEARPVEMSEVSVGVDSTSPIGSNITILGYKLATINHKLMPVPIIERAVAGGSGVTVKVPKLFYQIGTCILRIEFAGGNYNSVSGSGYSILKVDGNSLLLNITSTADEQASITVKLSDS